MIKYWYNLSKINFILIYKLFNKLIDKLTGFDIDNELNNVLKFERWSREQIEKYQQEKFNILKGYACKAEIYKDYLYKDLIEFPIYSKDYVKRNFEKFITNIRKPYSIVHTSGSTGNPLPIYVSKEMLLAKRISHQKILIWYDLQRESREFKIGGLRSDWKTIIYHYLKNKRYINSFEISPKNLKQITKLYNNFNPEILYGYPSAISNLISYAETNYIILKHPKIIVTHAENLYIYMVNQFKRYFPNAKIVNQYWSTEANIGVTCPAGNIHIDEDAVICEVINVDENGVGDLILTNLYSFDFPFIRYKNGDRVKLSDKTCLCGRRTKLIEKIEGREIDYFILPDGSKISTTAINIGIHTQNIISFQLIYKQREKRLIFQYVPIDKNKSINEEQISTNLLKDCGLHTDFQMVNNMKLTKGGKYLMLIIDK